MFNQYFTQTAKTLRSLSQAARPSVQHAHILSNAAGKAPIAMREQFQLWPLVTFKTLIHAVTPILSTCLPLSKCVNVRES